MLKKLISAGLITALLFSLSACGSKNNSNNGTTHSAQSDGDSALSTDFQRHMKTMDCFRINAASETGTGWYFQYNGLLYYIDKETMKAIPVCSKPDCKHNDNTCNSWVNTLSLNYYAGSLYYDNSDLDKTPDGIQRLFSMALDGAEHKEEQTLQLQYQRYGTMSPTIIHKGVVYFVYANAVYMAPIGTKAEKAILLYGDVTPVGTSDSPSASDLCWKLFAEGDYIYFMGNITQKDDTMKDTLFRYDTNSKETKQVWQVPEASEVGAWGKSGVAVTNWYIKDDNLYFYLSGNDLWRCDLNGGKNELVSSVSDKISESGFAIFSDDNIFIINDHVGTESEFGKIKSKADTVFVYDYDGKLVKELSLNDLNGQVKSVSNVEMLWAGDNKLLLYVAGDAETYQQGTNVTGTNVKERLVYIDIESGALSFIESWTGWNGI